MKLWERLADVMVSPMCLVMKLKIPRWARFLLLWPAGFLTCVLASVLCVPVGLLIVWEIVGQKTS